MVNIVDPQQNELFDTFSQTLSPVAHKRLRKSWPGVFRQLILSQMPAGDIGEHFDPVIGRPTKELHSIAGLLLIMEFKTHMDLGVIRPHGLGCINFVAQ